MSRLRARLSAARARVAGYRTRAIALGGRLVKWWRALAPIERITYQAMVLLAIGMALIWLPLAFLAPGSLYAIAYLVFILRRVGNDG